MSASEIRRQTAAIWERVAARREERVRLNPADSMEAWSVYEDAWIDRLDDCLTLAVEGKVDNGSLDGALVDLLAVASAWLDALGRG